MAFRFARRRLQQVQLPQKDDIEAQVPYRHVLSDRKKYFTGWRIWTPSRLQNWLLFAGILGGSAIVLGPWLVEETRESLGYSQVRIEAPSTLTRTTPDWWENEWRKMNITWRKGELVEQFWKPNYDYLAQVLGGRRMEDPLSWRRGVTKTPSSDTTSSDTINKKSGGGLASWFGMSSSSASSSTSTSQRPRALVPLCGDTPMLRELVHQGYEVDGVDSSETAVHTAVEKMEPLLTQAEFKFLHLHWKDFFSPALWRQDLGRGKENGAKYDFIYDRQGMTAVNPDQREDYAYLLKRALKDDGVIFIEGSFRTGRVKGNKVRGPPYGLSRAQLKDLFPERDGFFVQCRDTEDNAIRMLDRESKVLRRVPKELYVTMFPCVVYRDASVAAPQTV